jgi:hypothetical protein
VLLGPTMLIEANGASLDGCLIWNNFEIFEKKSLKKSLIFSLYYYVKVYIKTLPKIWGQNMLRYANKIVH